MSLRFSRRTFVPTLAAPVLFSAPRATAYWIYIGASSRRNSRGIYVSRLDALTGEMSAPRLAAETADPLFLAVHPSGGMLYATGALPGTDGIQGCVNAYAISAAGGELTFLNRTPTRGGLPVYLSVHPNGQTLAAANYRTGSVAAIPLLPSGGLGQVSSFSEHAGTGPHPKRQASPHAHCVEFSRDGGFILAPDLGIDKVIIYRFDAAASKIALNDPMYFQTRAGAGPRHITFHPKRPAAYLLNELDSTIVALEWSRPRGAISALESVSTLPTGYKGRNVTAEIRVHPGGRYLYASNRGHNSIAVFSISGSGKLAPVEHVPSGGEIPNSFVIDPQGRWLIAVNQNSDTVNAFAIGRDGRLTAGGAIGVDSPAAVRLAPAR